MRQSQGQLKSGMTGIWRKGRTQAVATFCLLYEHAATHSRVWPKACGKNQKEKTGLQTNIFTQRTHTHLKMCSQNRSCKTRWTPHCNDHIPALSYYDLISSVVKHVTELRKKTNLRQSHDCFALSHSIVTEISFKWIMKLKVDRISPKHQWMNVQGHGACLLGSDSGTNRLRVCASIHLFPHARELAALSLATIWHSFPFAMFNRSKK